MVLFFEIELYFTFSFSILLSFLFNLFRRYFAFENVEDECALTRISCEADVVIKGDDSWEYTVCFHLLDKMYDMPKMPFSIELYD